MSTIFNNDQKLVTEELNASNGITSGGDFQDPTRDKIASSKHFPASLERAGGPRFSVESPGSTFPRNPNLLEKTRAERTQFGVSNPDEFIPEVGSGINKETYIPSHYQAHPFGVQHKPFKENAGSGSTSHNPYSQSSSDAETPKARLHNNPFFAKRDQLPTKEKPSGSKVGVGSLPGDIHEPGVATLPEEREYGRPYGTYRTGFEEYSPADGVLRTGGDPKEVDLTGSEFGDTLSIHRLVHEHVAGQHDHHVMSKWELPSHEVPSGSRCGVGSLPGKNTEQRVAMLPEERLFPVDDILGSHLPLRMDEMPSMEHISGSVVGVGSLPGKRNEQRVAMTPEERLFPADEILGSHLPPRMDQMPSTEHISGSVVGVGSLPGKHSEQRVAMLPEERLFPADEILNSHLPPSKDQMPSTEHPSGSQVGVGSLPGKRSEMGVALLPEERLHPANEILNSHLPPRMEQMPSMEHPSGSLVGVGSLPGKRSEMGVALLPEERLHPSDGILNSHSRLSTRKEELPSTEHPSGSRMGVGSLPGKRSEMGVALLPEERLHPADEILNSHLPPRMEQMPSMEHPSGSLVGVGSLPGKRSEMGVALLPEERLHPADAILNSHLPPRMDQMPSREHPSGSIVGVGSLPGNRNEVGVAVLPDERKELGLDKGRRHISLRKKTSRGPRESRAASTSEAHPEKHKGQRGGGQMSRTSSGGPMASGGEGQTQRSSKGRASSGGPSSHEVKRPSKGRRTRSSQHVPTSGSVPRGGIYTDVSSGGYYASFSSKKNREQMPSTETPSGSSVGVGSLPGGRGERGVALLPEERLHDADEILMSHLPPRQDQLPTTEHPSNSKVGVGSLPGLNTEFGVAILPDERGQVLSQYKYLDSLAAEGKGREGVSESPDVYGGIYTDLSSAGWYYVPPHYQQQASKNRGKRGAGRSMRRTKSGRQVPVSSDEKESEGGIGSFFGDGIKGAMKGIQEKVTGFVYGAEETTVYAAHEIENQAARVFHGVEDKVLGDHRAEDVAGEMYRGAEGKASGLYRDGQGKAGDLRHEAGEKFPERHDIQHGMAHSRSISDSGRHQDGHPHLHGNHEADTWQNVSKPHVSDMGDRQHSQEDRRAEHHDRADSPLTIFNADRKMRMAEENQHEEEDRRKIEERERQEEVVRRKEEADRSAKAARDNSTDDAETKELEEKRAKRVSDMTESVNEVVKGLEETASGVYSGVEQTISGIFHRGQHGGGGQAGKQGPARSSNQSLGQYRIISEPIDSSGSPYSTSLSGFTSHPTRSAPQSQTVEKQLKGMDKGKGTTGAVKSDTTKGSDKSAGMPEGIGCTQSGLAPFAPAFTPRRQLSEQGVTKEKQPPESKPELSTNIPRPSDTFGSLANIDSDLDEGPSLEYKKIEERLDAAKAKEERAGVHFGPVHSGMIEHRTSPTEPIVATQTSVPANLYSEYLKLPDPTASDIIYHRGEQVPSIDCSVRRGRDPERAVKGLGGVEFSTVGTGGMLLGYPTPAGMSKLMYDRMRDDHLRSMEAGLAPSGVSQSRPATSKMDPSFSTEAVRGSPILSTAKTGPLTDDKTALHAAQGSSPSTFSVSDLGNAVPVAQQSKRHN